MNESRLQRLAKLAKIGFLQWRITCAWKKLDKCQPHTPESRNTVLKLIALINVRNELRTPADVAQIEKERGLV
jgi:hypothetical protein